jgi:hypothetical protein
MELTVVDDPSPGDIASLVGRYADAVLRADAHRFAALWTEDAEWHLQGSDPVRGRQSIVETFVRSRSRFRLCVQEVMSGYVGAAGDSGMTDAHWQVRELQWLSDGSGREVIGVYHDSARPVAGAWRFARRRFELVYRGPLDLPGRVFFEPASG